MCNDNAAQLVYLSSTLAVAIAEGRSAEEIAVLGAFFNTLGDALGVIATQKAFCESQNAKKD